MSREFVVFVEKNYHENETFLFYLQWTGNEDAIRLLEQNVKSVDYDDYPGSLTLDTSIKITEDAVDQMCKVDAANSYHKMFTKCTGVFTCTFEDRDVNTDTLYDMFYPCKISQMFSEYRNLYKEYITGKITKDEYYSMIKSI
jgi:hypothetical protein